MSFVTWKLKALHSSLLFKRYGRTSIFINLAPRHYIPQSQHCLTLENITATSSVSDLSRTLLLLGSFSGIRNILDLSDNARYEFKLPRGDDERLADWSGNQSETLIAPVLALMFGEHMYSPQGWIFGSSDDSDKCDVQLATNNTTVISRQHFRIDVSPSMDCPRLTVLSGNPVSMTALYPSIKGKS